MESIKIGFFGSASFVVHILKSVHSSQNETLGKLALYQYRNLDKSIKDFLNLEENVFESSLLSRKIQLALIITQPDSMNRGKIFRNNIAQFAHDHSITLFQPESIKNDLDTNKFTENLDIGIVAAYGQILPKSLIDNFKYGLINWHPSLLPKYRGSTPIQESILSKDKKTGLSWIDIVEKMDAGDIYLQNKYIVGEKDNFNTLADLFSNLGAEQWALVVALKILYSEKSILNYKPLEQDTNKTSFCKLISKDKKLIIPNQISTDQLIAHFKAYIYFPGTVYYSDYFNDFIKIKKIGSKLVDKSSEDIENTFNYKEFLVIRNLKKQNVYITTKSGYVEICEVVNSAGKNINFQGYQF
jgi:methionyl-tRNA formyltransferase